MKNLWILTEERPKKNVLQMIFTYFAKDHNCGFFGGDLHIIPLLNEKKEFNFTYKVIGFTCAKVNQVYIKTVSGSSSFVDFLIFYQDSEPTLEDTPLYAIEETKTDDQESRNTGVYQRCSKFVFLQYYYPTTKMIMLYALQIPQKEQPTETYIFGTRLLLTLGVIILGKKLDPNIFKPFTRIKEVISYKNSMRQPPKGNTPITITPRPCSRSLQISGRLYKNDSLSHDPNIGALSIICAVLRKLGWKGKLEITQHGLSQHHVEKANKFVRIANKVGISLQGLDIPSKIEDTSYWHYERTGEKLATIFLHTVVENFTESYSIFENHAGCEKGYFMTSREYIPLAKYVDREAYKNGDKKQIVFIPDLVLLDVQENEIITIEGKKYQFRQQGIEELKNYDSFENLYLHQYYPHAKFIRTVVLYGSTLTEIIEVEIGFLLNQNGKIVLGIRAPKLFVRAIRHLLDYWQ